MLVLFFITEIQEKNTKHKSELIYILSDSNKNEEEEKSVQLLSMKLQINVKKLFIKIILKNTYQKKKFKQEIISIYKLVQEKNFYENFSKKSLYKIF